jgi:hypothetical protein
MQSSLCLILHIFRIETNDYSSLTQNHWLKLLTGTIGLPPYFPDRKLNQDLRDDSSNLFI